MDERMIFAVLKLEKTKDEDAIRAAYRTLLARTNPEDDPEGFKRLREAYEKALEYARKQEAEEAAKQEDTTPVGLWMRRVKEIYFSLPRRLDEEEWKQLVHEDICMDLEYGEAAKWQLFTFLSEHYQLKSQIYQILNEVFGVTEYTDTFREYLPVGFVNFMLQKIGDASGSMNFDYEDFQGADDADYDGFLNYYYTLCDQTQNGDGAAAEQTVRAMEDMDIYHPLFFLEKARMFVLCGKTEEAFSIIRPLLSEKPDGLRIQILGAEVLYKCGYHEEAEEIFRKYEEGEYFLVEKYLTFCEKEKGNLERAIKHCLKALQAGNDEVIEKLLPEMDDAFIEKYAHKAENSTLTDTEATCLMGAYSRRNRPQEAVDFLEKYPDYARRMEHLHEYLCTLYYQLERFRDGIKECSLWREQMMAKEQELSEGKKQEEESRSYSMEGDGWYQLGKQGEEGAYVKAEEAYKIALDQAPDNLNIKQKVMDTAIVLEKYEEAILMADELIAANEGWFPAYVQKQKACFELHRAQEVINCFYDAKRIYAGFAPMYEKAVEIFCIYRQYGDAEGILAQAKEANVTSLMLDVFALRCMRIKEVNELQELRRQGRSEDFRLNKELTEFSKETKKKYKENPGESKEMYALFEELGLIERDRKHFKEAAAYFKKALKYEDKANAHYLLANALFDNNERTEALEEYRICEQMNGPEEYLYINMARCYRANGQRNEAIETFKKALGVNPENDEANGAIVRLYREMMVDSGNRYYGHLAKPFADRQLELMPNDAYYLRERGLLLMEMNSFEEALTDFDRALEVEAECYGYNLKGKALYYLGKYEAALVCFEESIRCMEQDDRFSAPYLNMGDSLRRLGRIKEAEDWYRKGIKAAGEGAGSTLYNNLYWLHRVEGRFEEAKAVLEEQWKAKKMSDDLYHRLTLNMDELIHKDSSSSYVERAKKLAQQYDSVDAWLELSYQYQYETDNLYKALEAARQAFQKAEEKDLVWGKYPVLLQLIELYSLLTEKELAAKYANIFLEELQKVYGYNPDVPAEVQFMEHLQSDKDNTYDLARVYLGLGDLEKAQKCLEKLLGPGFCRKCNKRGCTEAYHLKGMICEEKGMLEDALKSYQIAVNFDKGMRESIYRIRRLEKKRTGEKGIFSFLCKTRNKEK